MKRRFFEALEGTVDFCFLGEKFCWHAILPDPARPLRRALRPDPPVVCPGFGFDSFGVQNHKCIHTYDFACACFWENIQGTCPRCFGGYEGRLSSGRTVLLAPRPTRPRPGVPPCASNRPARGMSGFWIRQVVFSNMHN